jgi:hypothetical protein
MKVGGRKNWKDGKRKILRKEKELKAIRKKERKGRKIGGTTEKKVGRKLKEIRRNKSETT